MSFSNVDQVNPTATKLIIVESDPTGSAARVADPNDNVTGAAPGYIHMVEIDNHLNTADTYVKFRFAASVTISGGEAHMQLLAPAREVVNYAFPGGVYYTTGLSVWIVTGNTTADTTMPLSKVLVKILST
ncbi:hypothetical protein CMI37_36115 [Candidatus Pacearchaeota archaeon]|jgi:hypothetical protein|nr:hypothetical protein [Candidatus Pacearchaeota archaeon]|tara:strand:+ start:2353 stop:2742 length:390 start_codon:yes stop_codon:yes gene_type:complete